MWSNELIPEDRHDRDARIELLGEFAVRAGGRHYAPGMNAARLLSYLALNDRPLRRAAVAGSLWPGVTDARAGGNLRTLLWRLDPALSALIDATAEHLALSSRVAVDVRECEAQARRILDRTAPLTDAHVNDTVLSEDLLPSWSEEWVVQARERFRLLRLRALETLCGRLTDAGRFGEAVQAGLTAVTAEPLRESARRMLIRAYLAQGNAAAAVRELNRFRAVLRDELELDPTPTIIDLVADGVVPSVRVG